MLFLRVMWEARAFASMSFCRGIKVVSVCLIVHDTALMKRQKTLSDSDK